MKKTFRILAIIGCICLVGMNVVTLILAMTDNPNTMTAFRASLFCTIIIPVLLWTYSMVYRVLKGQGEKKNQQSAKHPVTPDDPDVPVSESITDETGHSKSH